MFIYLYVILYVGFPETINPNRARFCHKGNSHSRSAGFRQDFVDLGFEVFYRQNN
jgi:hypothetical protein